MWPFKPKSVVVSINEQLYEARQDQLKHAANAEHHAALDGACKARIARLEFELQRHQPEVTVPAIARPAKPKAVPRALRSA